MKLNVQNVNKNRLVLLLLLQVVSYHLLCQNLNFSNDILNSKDNEIKAIKTLWENYFNFYSSHNDSTKTFFLNKMERTEATDDIIKYAISRQRPIYNIGEHFTFDIRKLNDEFYEIFTQLKFKKNIDDETIFMIYRVCAKKDDGTYKLYNAFYYEKQLLKSMKIGDIDYYYPCSYLMSSEKINDAKNAVKTLDSIQKYYHIKPKFPITYIVAPYYFLYISI